MSCNSIDIYAKQATRVFLSPFRLQVDPIRRLLLIGFEKDPDEVYIGFEPQVIDHPQNGRRLRIIAWRKDGYVDVYQQPGLSKDDDFAVAGMGLADLLERPLVDARFELGPTGLDVYFAFEDKQGRAIEVAIVEKHERPAKPFTLLAPVGHGSTNPTSFPLFFLFDFYFVRQKGTEVTINIDGVAHRPDPFPFPLDGAKCYYMRYAADTFMATWNETVTGPLLPLHPPGAGEFAANGIVYSLVDNQGHLEIQQMTAANATHQVAITFEPPVPDLVALKDGISVIGEFQVTSDKSAGSLDGTYEIKRTGDKVQIQVHPSGGWKPHADRFFLKFLFFVGSVFRNWPKSYFWTAHITLQGDEAAEIESHWERI